MNENDLLGDYDQKIELDKDDEYNVLNFIQNLRDDGNKLFKSSQFCRQTIGYNLWRITQFSSNAGQTKSVSDQYIF